MQIFPSVTWHLDRWLKHSVQCALGALFLVIVGIVGFFFLYPWALDPFTTEAKKGSAKLNKAILPLETIGSGALALHPRHALGWVSRLADELIVLSYNSRPDVRSSDAQILLMFKTGKQLWPLCNGAVMYLKENAEGRGLHPSLEPTGLWVKPILLEDGAILVEAGRKLKQAEEIGQFILTAQGGIPGTYNPAQLACVKQLESSNGVFHDLLIQKYGGKEYSSWKNKAVLEVTKEVGTYALFVSPGEYLQYEDEEWRITPLQQLQSSCPIAHVKLASDRAVELQVWDEKGFHPLNVKIEMQKPERLQPKPDEVPSAIRLRSGTQVSCAFGKRRLILKQGDWLLKTPSGWRNLRKLEDIQQCIDHRLRGELFIFDGIENEQGKSVLKGHFFDITRSQIQPLSIPIDADKTQKILRKKKPPHAEKRVV